MTVKTTVWLVLYLEAGVVQQVATQRHFYVYYFNSRRRGNTGLVLLIPRFCTFCFSELEVNLTL